MKVKDAWFILTDLGSLPVALSAYKQRMGIEERVVLHSNDNG